MLSSDVWRQKIGIWACVSQHNKSSKLFQNWKMVSKTDFSCSKKTAISSPPEKLCDLTRDSGTFLTDKKKFWSKQSALVVTINVIDASCHWLGMSHRRERDFQWVTITMEERTTRSSKADWWLYHSEQFPRRIILDQKLGIFSNFQTYIWFAFDGPMFDWPTGKHFWQRISLESDFSGQ